MVTCAGFAKRKQHLHTHYVLPRGNYRDYFIQNGPVGRRERTREPHNLLNEEEHFVDFPNYCFTHTKCSEEKPGYISMQKKMVWLQFHSLYISHISSWSGPFPKHFSRLVSLDAAKSREDHANLWHSGSCGHCLPTGYKP